VQLTCGAAGQAASTQAEIRIQPGHQRDGPPARAPVLAADDRRHVAPARRTRHDRRGQAHPRGPSPQLTAGNWRRDMTCAHRQGHADVSSREGADHSPCPGPRRAIWEAVARRLDGQPGAPRRVMPCREDGSRAADRGTGPAVRGIRGWPSGCWRASKTGGIVAMAWISSHRRGCSLSLRKLTYIYGG
jgi:hypothetical protein